MEDFVEQAPENAMRKRSFLALSALSLLQIGMHATTHGGLDRFYHGLVSELTRMQVPLRGLVFGERSEQNAAPVQSLGPVSLSGRERLWRIRQAGRSYLRTQPGPCLVASHFALYAAPLLDLLFRFPHVVHFQGPWSGESAAEGQPRLAVFSKRQVERLVYRSARKLIVLSGAFRELLVQDFGIDPAKIEVIPGGIDTAAFLPSGSRAQARAQLGWPPDRPIILCVRRLTQRMGLEQLLEAMLIVRARHPNALLLIAGKGALSAKLAEQITALGLSAHVRLLGFVSDEELPLAYCAANLSVVPSQALEGFGLITLESLAAGTPVLVTPVGGLPDTVQALNPQLILRGKAPADLAEGLCAALDGRLPLPSEEECQSHVRNRFDWSVIAPRVLQVYQAAVTSPR